MSHGNGWALAGFSFGLVGVVLGLVTMLLPPVAMLSGPCGIAAIGCALAGWRSTAPSSGGEWISSAALALGTVTRHGRRRILGLYALSD